MLVMDDVLHPDAPEKVRFVHPERIRPVGEVHHQDVGRHLGVELDAHRHRWRMGCLLHVVHGRLALDLAYPLDVALILGVESQKLLA